MKKKGSSGLGLLAWLHHVGADNADAVATSAGLSPEYLRKLAYTRSPVAYRTAKRIIDAAQACTPGWAPDLFMLLEGQTETPDNKAGRGRLQPSPQFLASRSARQRARGARQ